MSNVITWKASTLPNIAWYNIYKFSFSLLASNPAPYNIPIGSQLQIQTEWNHVIWGIQFLAEDFVDITHATIDEIAKVIERETCGEVCGIDIPVFSPSSGTEDFLEIRKVKPKHMLQVIPVVSGIDANIVFGFSLQKIYERSYYNLLTSVVNTPSILNYTYTDVDGRINDWYRITTVDTSAVESIPTLAKRSYPLQGETCVVEGDIEFQNGVPLADQHIHCKLALAPRVSDVTLVALSYKEAEYLSDIYGRFEIPLLRHAYYYIEIPEIKFSRTVYIPNEDIVNLFQLPAVDVTLHGPSPQRV